MVSRLTAAITRRYSLISKPCSRNRRKLAIGCDPNDAPNARAVVTARQQRGAFITTIWNKTEDLHPILATTTSPISAGLISNWRNSAQVQFDAMGKKGGIVGGRHRL